MNKKEIIKKFKKIEISLFDKKQVVDFLLKAFDQQRVECPKCGYKFLIK